MSSESSSIASTSSAGIASSPRAAAAMIESHGKLLDSSRYTCGQAVYSRDGARRENRRGTAGTRELGDEIALGLRALSDSSLTTGAQCQSRYARPALVGRPARMIVNSREGQSRGFASDSISRRTCALAFSQSSIPMTT